MDAKIIAIGNSRGVRLPRVVLDKLRLQEGDAVEIELTPNAIVLRPGAQPRADWAQRFAAAPGVAEDLWEGVPPAEAWDK